MRGTPIFASLDSHNQQDVSLKDDLETLCYTMLFLEGENTLPWSSISKEENDSKAYMNVIRKEKQALRDELMIFKINNNYEINPV